jgi:hypothetical protein
MVFIVIFGKSYRACFLFLQYLLIVVEEWTYYCFWYIVTVGFHVTTAIMFITNTVYRNMLYKRMNSSVAHFRHTPTNKDVLYIK